MINNESWTNLKAVFRYGAFSSVGLAVDLAIFFIFAKMLNFNYVGVATMAFIVATLVNYELCAKFVFERGVRFDNYSEIVLIFIVSAMGLVLTQATLYFMVSIESVDLMTSKITASFITFLWNYLVRKFFVFKKVVQQNSSTSPPSLETVEIEKNKGIR